MAVRKMILKDSAGSTELVLPVTPSEFQVSFGRNVLKVNIHQMGDINLWGQSTAATVKVSALFPASERSYAFTDGYTGNPYGAIELLHNWQTQGKILRYIISDTPVNMAVLLADVSYGEQDGTGDVYAELTLQEYRETGAIRTQTGSAKTRTAESGGVFAATQSYAVAKGDTLWAIARKFYGDATLCYSLATYNGIQNANLIFPGQIVKIPDKGALS